MLCFVCTETSNPCMSLRGACAQVNVVGSPWVENGKEKALPVVWLPLQMGVGAGVRGLGAVRRPLLLPQDVADFEWVMWFTSFRNVIIFALSGHVLFGKICSMAVPQVSQG